MPATAKKSSKGKSRNYELIKGTGLMRFSRARMYGKKAIYITKKFHKKPEKVKKTEEKFIIKQIGGAKNGGERKVPIKKEVKINK